MLVFPALLDSVQIPAALDGSLYVSYWPVSVLSTYMLADLIGRHMSPALMLPCAPVARSETSAVLIVALIVLQLAAVYARTYYLWTTILHPVYILQEMPSLGGTLSSALTSAGVAGASNGLIGTLNVLVTNRVVEPHEKVCQSCFSIVILNIRYTIYDVLLTLA